MTRLPGCARGLVIYGMTIHRDIRKCPRWRRGALTPRGFALDAHARAVGAPRPQAALTNDVGYSAIAAPRSWRGIRMPFRFEALPLEGILLIQPSVFEDERGFFMESYQARDFARAGVPAAFVQDNHSRSRQGTLRGLHYQIRQAQGKLVRVTSGEIFDVAVDLRKSSPTLGLWLGTVLSAQTRKQLWIPAGFAHGFYALSDWAEVLYKSTDFYAHQSERTLRWDDPTVAIEWPLIGGRRPILSDKDAAGSPFAQAELFA